MSIKAHKKPDGTWAVCKASLRPCPYGGSEVPKEFESERDIVKINSDKVYNENLSDYGLLPNIKDSE